MPVHRKSEKTRGKGKQRAGSVSEPMSAKGTITQAPLDPGPSMFAEQSVTLFFEDPDLDLSSPPDYTSEINPAVYRSNTVNTLRAIDSEIIESEATIQTDASSSLLSSPAASAAPPSSFRRPSVSPRRASWSPGPTSPETTHKPLPTLPPQPLTVTEKRPLRTPSYYSQPQLLLTPPRTPTETAQHAKEVMLGFLRDVISWPQPWTSGPPLSTVLQGCAKACTVYGLSLAMLLQETSLEEHSLLYWVVVGHTSPANPASSEDDTHEDPLMMFIEFAVPLSKASVSELRLACIQNGSEKLFQHLRPFLSSSLPSGKEQMLLGVSSSHSPEIRSVSWNDDIQVWYTSENPHVFLAQLRIQMFQRRMKVVEHVDVEFIASGRIWVLKFLIASTENSRNRPSARTGSWVVTLSLLDHSPPTAVNACLVLESAPDPRTSAFMSSGVISVSGAQEVAPTVKPRRAKAKKHDWFISRGTAGEHTMRLKSEAAQLVPDRSNSYAWAIFKDDTVLDSLQHQNGQPYISADGCLHARLEVCMDKSESGCVIC